MGTNVVTGASIIPFQPSIANCDFDCAINGVTYNFRQRWNDRAALYSPSGELVVAGAWYFDVTAADQTPIISGVKIVLGAYLGRQSNDPLFTQGVFTAWDSSGGTIEAGFDDLTTRVIVQYIPVLELIRRLGLPSS